MKKKKVATTTEDIVFEEIAEIDDHDKKIENDQDVKMMI